MNAREAVAQVRRERAIATMTDMHITMSEAVAIERTEMRRIIMAVALIGYFFGIAVGMVAMRIIDNRLLDAERAAWCTTDDECENGKQDTSNSTRI